MTTDLHDPVRFRSALRGWLDENDLTPPEDHSLAGHMRQFARVQKALYDADWGRYGWPEHAGGLGGPAVAEPAPRCWSSQSRSARTAGESWRPV